MLKSLLVPMVLLSPTADLVEGKESQRDQVIKANLVDENEQRIIHGFHNREARAVLMLKSLERSREKTGDPLKKALFAYLLLILSASLLSFMVDRYKNADIYQEEAKLKKIRNQSLRQLRNFFRASENNARKFVDAYGAFYNDPRNSNLVRRFESTAFHTRTFQPEYLRQELERGNLYSHLKYWLTDPLKLNGELGNQLTRELVSQSIKSS